MADGVVVRRQHQLPAPGRQSRLHDERLVVAVRMEHVESATVAQQPAAQARRKPERAASVRTEATDRQPIVLVASWQVAGGVGCEDVHLVAASSHLVGEHRNVLFHPTGEGREQWRDQGNPHALLDRQ
jgi:hypothetical protein